MLSFILSRPCNWARHYYKAIFLALKDAVQCFLKFALLLQLYKDCLRLADYIGSKVRGQPFAFMTVLDDVCFIL